MRKIIYPENRYIDQIVDVLPQAVILISGVWLRFADLSRPSLWIDEAFVQWFINRPWSGMIYILHLDGGNLPVHFLFVKFFSGLIGDNEFGLRFFSAISGSVAIALSMALGWQVGKQAGSIAAGWFWAFCPIAVWYARDAKPYAFASMISLALLILYFNMRKATSVRLYLLVLPVMIAGLLSHYYFFLVVMALLMFSMVDIKDQPTFFRRWYVLSTLAFIPLAGWIFWFFTLPTPMVGIGWIQKPAIYDLFGTIWNLYSGFGGQYSISSTVFGWIGILLSFVGLMQGEGKKSSGMSLIFGLLIPILAVWVVSQRRAIYMDRYFIVLLPYAGFLVSTGMTQVSNYLIRKLKKPFLQAAVATGYVIFLGTGILAGWQVHIAEKYAKEDWRGLASQLSQRDREAPEIWLLDPESQVAFRYYFSGEAHYINSGVPPQCSECWYVLRQPYTATHAFAQGVMLANRPWKPKLPQGCSIENRWESLSGLALWKVNCTGSL